MKEFAGFLCATHVGDWWRVGDDPTPRLLHEIRHNEQHITVRLILHRGGTTTVLDIEPRTVLVKCRKPRASELGADP